MASRDINLATYARHLKSGVFGGRALFHVAPHAVTAGYAAVHAAIGSDAQMRNLFTKANPVTAGIKYTWTGKDTAVVKLRPAGMFTIMARQSGIDVAGAVYDGAAAAWGPAIQKVIREDY